MIENIEGCISRQFGNSLEGEAELIEAVNLDGERRGAVPCDERRKVNADVEIHFETLFCVVDGRHRLKCRHFRFSLADLKDAAMFTAADETAVFRAELVLDAPCRRTAFVLFEEHRALFNGIERRLPCGLCGDERTSGESILTDAALRVAVRRVRKAIRNANAFANQIRRERQIAVAEQEATVRVNHCSQIAEDVLMHDRNGVAVFCRERRSETTPILCKKRRGSGATDVDRKCAETGEAIFSKPALRLVHTVADHQGAVTVDAMRTLRGTDHERQEVIVRFLKVLAIEAEHAAIIVSLAFKVANVAGFAEFGVALGVTGVFTKLAVIGDLHVCEGRTGNFDLTVKVQKRSAFDITIDFQRQNLRSEERRSDGGRFESLALDVGHGRDHAFLRLDTDFQHLADGGTIRLQVDKVRFVGDEFLRVTAPELVHVALNLDSRLAVVVVQFGLTAHDGRIKPSLHGGEFFGEELMLRLQFGIFLRGFLRSLADFIVVGLLPVETGVKFLVFFIHGLAESFDVCRQCVDVVGNFLEAVQFGFFVCHVYDTLF
ncbi:hypothetical protein Ab1vBOLIVR4_gp120c [Agrobacterium phage OLIVR4]|nr:hypothetical protein Ab1vBOLIVR4_gp120c [Agrobacterium phage OLIVR4]